MGADTAWVNDDPPDIADVMSSSAFADVSAQPAVEPLAPLPDVVVGDVTFVAERSNRCEHGCDPQGFVAPGAGFWSGDPARDLCATCFVPQRDDSMRAPTPEDQRRFARLGIGSEHPFEVMLRSRGDADRLLELVEEHDVVRVLVRIATATALELSDLRLCEVSEGARGNMQSGDVRSFELQLLGLASGPPIDPDLMARLEAAKEDRGCIDDAELANEYHEALIRQGEEMDRLMGRPEPIIERGFVFPAAAGEEPLDVTPDPSVFPPHDPDDDPGDGSPVQVIIS